jgi:HAD superfamily hydrolase (TIGR01662 family)
MKLETVVFDLGGTLIEYAGPYASWPELETPGFVAAYELLQLMGYRMPPFAEFKEAGFALIPVMWRAAVRHEQNLTVRGLLQKTVTAVALTKISDEAIQAAAHRYGQAIQAQAYAIERAVETVQAVKAAGFKVGLVSNTMFPAAMHQEDMRRFGLLEHFDALIFSADTAKWKPNADPFLQLLDELDADPQTAVYIGDDPTSDIMGGQAAGMHTIFFHSSNRFPKPTPQQRPSAEIYVLDQLIPLLHNPPFASP